MEYLQLIGARNNNLSWMPTSYKILETFINEHIICIVINLKKFCAGKTIDFFPIFLADFT